MKTIIVDMDNTLTKSSWRNPLTPALKGGDWDPFHERCQEDEPTNLVDLVRILSEFFQIVITTARPERFRTHTTNWLTKHNIRPARILMRGDESNASSPDVKIEHVDFLMRNGFKIAFGIDDRKDVCDAWEKMGIPSYHYDMELLIEPAYPDEPVAIERSTRPEQILSQASKLFKKKNQEYGDSYKDYGKLLFTLFPEGVKLETEADFVRWGTTCMMLAKIHRYANNYNVGHEDSLEDLAVYSAMQLSLDRELL